MVNIIYANTFSWHYLEVTLSEATVAVEERKSIMIDKALYYTYKLYLSNYIEDKWALSLFHLKAKKMNERKIFFFFNVLTLTWALR